MSSAKRTIKLGISPGAPIAKLFLNPPGAARQVRFYQLLVAAGKQWFIDALSEALGQADQDNIQQEVKSYVPADVRKILAAAGIRDEHVFPVPAVLEIKPSLIGYYRLLLGAPQKSFYKSSTGLGRFKSMEEIGTISKQKPYIPAFCQAMAQPLSELVRQVPRITDRDLRELPLLTFGSQLQGSNNTQIGKTAMKEVFVAIKEIVAKHILETTEKGLVIRNSAGRTVLIKLSHDPDVRIQEQVGDSLHHRVAIEVKGGTDISNAHNRAGEAEKSHQKARRVGFPEFWTVISKQGLDVSKLRSESPTTNLWFDVADILGRTGPDWNEFKERIAASVSVPLD